MLYIQGGARTFHGLYIAYAARVDRMLVPESQPRHKARTGITKYMPRGPVLPAWTPAMVGVHAATATIVAAFLATTRARGPTLDP